SCLPYPVPIQHCLVNAGDVGCGVFECFENNSCEIRGLHEICMTFLHNAGKFDAQGKSFIKDALKCKAHALRHKFSCISRKCPAIKEMVFQLQRECYLKHDLCSAAKENVQVIQQTKHKLFGLTLCAQMQKSEPVFLAGERLTPETRRLSHSLASGLTLEHLPTTPLCLDISTETPNPSSEMTEIFLQNHFCGNFSLAFYFPHYPKELS
uniref:Stanniocalcin-2 n=1 Tax=Zosterops lateralis melanops TaxID=1220523 RepID=A0A8D2PBI4_ZOSLA